MTGCVVHLRRVREWLCMSVRSGTTMGDWCSITYIKRLQHQTTIPQSTILHNKYQLAKGVPCSTISRTVHTITPVLIHLHNTSRIEETDIMCVYCTHGTTHTNHPSTPHPTHTQLSHAPCIKTTPLLNNELFLQYFISFSNTSSHWWSKNATNYMTAQPTLQQYKLPFFFFPSFFWHLNSCARP